MHSFFNRKMHLSWINTTDSTRIYLPVSCWIMYEIWCLKDLQFQNKCIIWQTTSSFYCWKSPRASEQTSVTRAQNNDNRILLFTGHTLTQAVELWTQNIDLWPVKLHVGNICQRWWKGGHLSMYEDNKSWMLLMRFTNFAYTVRKSDTVLREFVFCNVYVYIRLLYALRLQLLNFTLTLYSCRFILCCNHSTVCRYGARERREKGNWICNFTNSATLLLAWICTYFF